MTVPHTAPYGSWKSPISPLHESLRLGQFVIDGGTVFWLEGRPAEQGRSVIVAQSPDGRRRDLTPPGFNARSRVHEYGGAPFLVAGDTLYFVNFIDQRIYHRPLAGEAEPLPLTPANALRYADLVLDRARNSLICVCEDHTNEEAEAENLLVRIPLSGATAGIAQPLARGNHFYASPRLSPDGKQLAWLTWNHPNMPWDGTELWVGALDATGNVTESVLVAGGREESIFQPGWSPGGTLHFVSDRSGWWNLYRRRDGKIEPLHPMEAEFGVPQWIFGQALYDFADDTRIICAYGQGGRWHLAQLETTTRAFTPIATPYTYIERVQVAGEAVWLAAGSPTEYLSLARLDLATGKRAIIQRTSNEQIEPGYIARSRMIEFPTMHGCTAHGFFYPPQNQDFVAPEGEKPPLLVMSHGGPVSATNDMLHPEIQYWTSRGIAVLDVNYGGSSGYGRAYRQRLNGNWGIVDVQDCIAGAQYLAAQRLVDGERLLITGGSAGGYTTLCALTFHTVFKAGASHYGISDLNALSQDSHKFEAHGLEILIGPRETQPERYIERSPIHFAHQLSCPIIFFQGLEDMVVPPNQSEMMVNALKAKGIPVAYLTFEGEQHGFRKQANIKRAIEGEFSFYARIFGFTPADDIEPVEILNFPAS